MTVKQCAIFCGVSERRIRDWIKIHEIEHEKNMVSGRIVISETVWIQFCSENNIERVVGYDERKTYRRT